MFSYLLFFRCCEIIVYFFFDPKVICYCFSEFLSNRASYLTDIYKLFTLIIIIVIFYSFCFTLCIIFDLTFPLLSLPFNDLSNSLIPPYPTRFDLETTAFPTPHSYLPFSATFSIVKREQVFHIFSLNKHLFAHYFPLHPIQANKMSLYWVRYLMHCFGSKISFKIHQILLVLWRNIL